MSYPWMTSHQLINHSWLSQLWSNQPWATIIAALISAILGGTLGTIVPMIFQHRRTKKAIKNVVRGQLEHVHRKAKEFIDGSLVDEEFRAGQPLYKTLYETFGFLSQRQAAQSSVALLLYFEVAKGRPIKKTRVEHLKLTCEEALKLF